MHYKTCKTEFREFCKKKTKNFAKIKGNFRFRFYCLNEIFAKEIERKFGNPR